VQPFLPLAGLGGGGGGDLLQELKALEVLLSPSQVGDDPF